MSFPESFEKIRETCLQTIYRCEHTESIDIAINDNNVTEYISS